MVLENWPDSPKRCQVPKLCRAIISNNTFNETLSMEAIFYRKGEDQMKTKEQKLVKIGIRIPEQRIQDLLCNALEGGSNYWYVIQSHNYPEGHTKDTLLLEFPHLELPFVGGSLTIRDYEGDQPSAILDKAACIKGLAIMAEKEASHFADFLAENDDATTGDVFLQYALWGQVIHG